MIVLKLIRRGAVLSAIVLLTACGGGDSLGDGGTGSTTGGTTGGDTGATAKSVTVIASAAQLPSAASTSATGVTITAIVKDANNALLSDVDVTFSADAGALEVTSATTDASGLATATLSTGGDPTNQIITVTAKAGTVSSSLKIPEVGTSLAITGASTVGSTATEIYTVKLTDSSGDGIAGKTVTLGSSLGNTISPASAETDAGGSASFNYVGINGGSDELLANSDAVNASASSKITVSSSKLSFTSPTSGTQIDFGVPQSVTVNYSKNGAAVAGATVNFSATRGTVSSPTAVTNANGNATVTIQSDGTGGAGGSVVSAQVTGGPSSSLPLVFNAVTPKSISIQASPSTIAPSSTSIVTATVRDAYDNLVANKLVNFTLSDTTGGSLSVASGTTGQSGTVTTTYTASTTTSAADGVVVNASVNSAGITTSNPAKITVGGKALFITLGTGNTIAALDDTRYQLPYSVLLTDAAGNPVSDATFRLSIRSIAYQKGDFVWSDAAGAYVQRTTIPNTDPAYNSGDFLPFGCASEDVSTNGSYNGILDAGEDYNKNSKLDPGFVATVPDTVALDDTGSAQFMITYPKDHAYWVEVQLTGIASVGGTETLTTATFALPGLAADYNKKTTIPPGQTSPYGTATNCSDKN